MFKLINGWTKRRVMNRIKKYNKNRKAERKTDFVGQCVYETKSGNRCAVGCFIPDEHVGLTFVGTADNLLLRYPELEKLMPFEPEALKIFQAAHDYHDQERNKKTGKKLTVYESIAKFLKEQVE